MKKMLTIMAVMPTLLYAVHPLQVNIQSPTIDTSKSDHKIKVRTTVEGVGRSYTINVKGADKSGGFYYIDKYDTSKEKRFFASHGINHLISRVVKGANGLLDIAIQENREVEVNFDRLNYKNHSPVIGQRDKFLELRKMDIENSVKATLNGPYEIIVEEEMKHNCYVKDMGSSLQKSRLYQRALNVLSQEKVGDHFVISLKKPEGYLLRNSHINDFLENSDFSMKRSKGTKQLLLTSKEDIQNYDFAAFTDLDQGMYDRFLAGEFYDQWNSALEKYAYCLAAVRYNRETRKKIARSLHNQLAIHGSTFYEGAEVATIIDDIRNGLELDEAKILRRMYKAYDQNTHRTAMVTYYKNLHPGQLVKLLNKPAQLTPELVVDSEGVKAQQASDEETQPLGRGALPEQMILQ